jgi:nitrogen regulatory protein PII
VRERLGLPDIRTEIGFMVAERNTAFEAMEKLNRDFEFEKPNHGIAFSTGVNVAIGAKCCEGLECRTSGKEENHMYHAITTIVERGSAEDVIAAAVKAGSKGGTILKARGSGIHETSKLFAMDIEPEKEMVLILSEAEKTEAIIDSIRREMKIDEPGKGILFVQDVSRTYGLYK